MRDDPPTMPGARAADGMQRAPGGPPTWPAVPGPPVVPAAPMSSWQPMLLVASLVANGALLACSLMLLVLARAGTLVPPGAAGQTGPVTSPSLAATSSPTAIPSPTAGAAWLQVAPKSVRLGCGAGQQTQNVVLLNTGEQELHWQVDYAGSGQVGVTVNTSEGDLRAGASVALQIQLRRHASDQQGVINFAPDSPNAGPPASLAYTIAGCQ